MYDEKKIDDSQHVEVISNEGSSLDDRDSIESTATGRVTWLITMTVSLGGFLFGYDTGVISAVLVSIRQDLDGRDLSSNEQELIVSSMKQQQKNIH